MIDFNIREYFISKGKMGAFVVVDAANTKIDLGLLDPTERETLAALLRDAANELSQEDGSLTVLEDSDG